MGFNDTYLDKRAVTFQQYISKITETAPQLIPIGTDLSPTCMMYVDTELFDLGDMRQCERMHSTLIKSFPSSAVCCIESDRYNSSTICFEKLSQKGNESIIERKVFKISKIHMLIYI